MRLFGPVLPGHHVLMLMPTPGEYDTKACIVPLTRFYGGPVEAIRLAEFDGPAAMLTETIVIVVNYENHVIQRMTPGEYEAFADRVGDGV